MATERPTVESLKPPRVLACVFCQSRKIRCDRQFPCANCIKAGARCIPGNQVPRQRRRRFPERVLLDRLRHYEDLLRQNNIKFEPLHPDSSKQKRFPDVQGEDGSDDEQSKAEVSPLTPASSERVYEAKNIWHAMSREFRDPDNASDSSDDDLREGVIRKVWDQVYETHDQGLLFGSPKTAVDISSLHPAPVQIFRLWQLYLENVDPLLKVTHIPSLQGRIIEAASSVFNITPTFEALMFSIYAMSVTTLDDDDCLAMFSTSRDDLLAQYQFGCQQALLNSSFLRTDDRDCLTALFLYLVSARTILVPQSLCSLLGIAIRIAERMGIHSEAALAKCSSALEAEMRRRLWWALVLYDARVGEISNFKNAILVPTWDCRVPLNVNDSDFRPEMKQPPQLHGTSSDALFAVVRSELGNVIRHSIHHLRFTNAALAPLANNVQYSESELDSPEKMIEDKYLQFCDLANPLHFMTFWMTRVHLTKCRLMEYHFKHSDSSLHQTEAQRDAAMSYALDILDGDTKLLASPLIKAFRWLCDSYFPFPAYMQILQHLKRQPLCEQAERAWSVLNDNYEARFDRMRPKDNPFFQMLMRIYHQAWMVREVRLGQLGQPFVTPNLIFSIRDRLPELALNLQSLNIDQNQNNALDMDMNNFAKYQVPMDFDSQNLLGDTGAHVTSSVPEPMAYRDLSEMAPLDIDVNQLDWSTMDWGFGGLSGW